MYRVLALKCCDNTIFDQFALLNNGRTTEPQGHHIGALKEIELTEKKFAEENRETWEAMGAIE